VDHDDATQEGEGQTLVKSKSFDEYPLWGDSLGSDFIFHEPSGMFFPTDYYHRSVEPLFQYTCQQTNCQFNAQDQESADVAQGGGAKDTAGGDEKEDEDTTHNQTNNTNAHQSPLLRRLQDHLRARHRLALCQLCCTHQRDFVANLPRFTPNQLKRHLQQGDGKGSGFAGHPVCEFCRPKRFYDLTLLHQHLNKEHYKCHVCQQLDLDNQFFKNYSSLQKHFDQYHYLCKHPTCLEARFVVFANDLDLIHHQRQVHGSDGGASGNSSTKIQLEFRVRRSPGSDGPQQDVPDANDFNYNLDGQAFVPAALPQSAHGATNVASDNALHPLHVQRTEELRQQAAALRQEASSGTEAFPSLPPPTQDAASQQQQSDRLRFGWTEGTTLQRVGQRKNAGEVTEQDFPSLPSGGGATTAAQRRRMGAAPVQRQFAAMNMASSAPTNSGWTGSSAAVVASPASTTATPTPNSFGANYPSLTSTARRNDASNLTGDNFPSLGPAPGANRNPGGRQQQPYTAANALAKKLHNNSANLSANNFPSLGATTSASVRHQYPAADALTQRNRQQAPSLNSTTDFPAPQVSMASSSQNAFRQKMVGKSPGAPSQEALANVLKAPTAASKATVEDMKASLGPANYKKLKNYTKEFVGGQLAPDAYVDHAAAVFDRGYADPDFWNFVPSLLESCPDEYASNQALQYMQHLKKMRNGALNAEAMGHTKAPSISSWSVSSSSVASAPSSGANVAPGQWSSVSGSRVTAPPSTTNHPGMKFTAVPAQTRAAPLPNTIAGKKKNAWGSSGTTSVVRAKAPPGSVSVAAAKAAAKPQKATATSYMAKETKANNQAASKAAGKKKKKGKQNNELRQLAFGS